MKPSIITVLVAAALVGMMQEPAPVPQIEPAPRKVVVKKRKPRRRLARKAV